MGIKESLQTHEGKFFYQGFLRADPVKIYKRNLKRQYSNGRYSVEADPAYLFHLQNAANRQLYFKDGIKKINDSILRLEVVRDTFHQIIRSYELEIQPGEE